LESFNTKYMKVNGQGYIDILAEAPYEFSWYNLWLQYDKTIDIHIREPLFKTFHHKNQHIEYLLRGIKTSDLARGYLGVNVNSNYSRNFGVISFDENRHKVLARYFSRGDVLGIVYYRFYYEIDRVLMIIRWKFKNAWSKYVLGN
jgi:hypothetical protein